MQALGSSNDAHINYCFLMSFIHLEAEYFIEKASKNRSHWKEWPIYNGYGCIFAKVVKLIQINDRMQKHVLIFECIYVLLYAFAYDSPFGNLLIYENLNDAR